MARRRLHEFMRPRILFWVRMGSTGSGGRTAVSWLGVFTFTNLLRKRRPGVSKFVNFFPAKRRTLPDQFDVIQGELIAQAVSITPGNEEFEGRVASFRKGDAADIDHLVFYS